MEIIARLGAIVKFITIDRAGPDAIQMSPGFGQNAHYRGASLALTSRAFEV
jgi:hypothetical protein